MECTRHQKLAGRAGAACAQGQGEQKRLEALSPQPGDYAIVKPRWSAFFQTELDLILRRLGVRTVILAETTKPNCIRTTCYDANALDYNVVVLSDCTSSQTEEIQRANLEDMERMGATIMDTGDFAHYGPDSVPRPGGGNPDGEFWEAPKKVRLCLADRWGSHLLLSPADFRLYPAC